MLNKEIMQSTPLTLANGTELCLYNDEQNTVLQLRQPAVDTNPLACSVQVGISLTAPECLELVTALMGYASKKVVAKPVSEDVEEKPSYSWKQQ